MVDLVSCNESNYYGLVDSIKELKGANVELTEEQIMSILLTNQYLDYIE